MFDICKHCENEGKEPCERCIYATRPYADNTIMLFDLFKKKEKKTMVIKICITEKPGGLVDLSISPELSNYPLDYSNMNPYRVESIDLPRNMVGEMVQKYIDKGGVV